jgi:beta-barrel assembly-enhancing protease
MNSLGRWVAFTCICVVSTGCVTDGAAPINLLSTEREIQLGAELAAEVEKEAKILEDAAIQAYINDIGSRLARVVPRQDVEYRFTVIDEPETINAFALPGGHMYIFTGLMKLCTNEAELASVMAHEIAHVAAHHHGEALTRQMGVSYLMSIALGENPAAAARLASQLLAVGFVNYYSREAEREADRLGMELLFRAGYKPEAMISFMERMMAAKDSGSVPGPLIFLSTHPATPARVSYLRDLALTYPLDQRMRAPLYQERYQEQALSRLN